MREQLEKVEDLTSMNNWLKINLIALAYWLFTLPLLAQNSNHTFGARSAAMGDASVVMNDLWASAHNQAGLASLQSMELGISFQNAYFIPENSTHSFAFTIFVSKLAL